MADPQRLQQVFINLLSNGCKYNRPGGSPTVSARTERDQVIIEFSDEGPGLNENEIAQIFAVQTSQRHGGQHGRLRPGACTSSNC